MEDLELIKRLAQIAVAIRRGEREVALELTVGTLLDAVYGNEAVAAELDMVIQSPAAHDIGHDLGLLNYPDEEGDPEETLSTSQAAHLLGMNPRTIQRLCSENKLPHWRTEKGYARIRREDAEAYRHRNPGRPRKD